MTEENKAEKSETPIDQSTLNAVLSMLDGKDDACIERIGDLKNDKNKTAFHSNGIMAQQIRQILIKEIIAAVKKLR